MILGIIQARVSSNRLPGKALKPILGEAMLWRQVERVKRAGLINNLIVATSNDSSDEPIEKLCQDKGVKCFRGSLDDVLDRFYRAAQLFDPEYIVRLTGDCPLADPQLIDEVIRFHLKGDFDYTSNALEPTYPDGLDTEVFRFKCLTEAWREAKLASQREHVTLFIYQQSQRFKIGNFKNTVDLSGLRWTVDEPVDLTMVNRIYKALYPQNPAFTFKDILGFLDKNPELKTINTKYKRNEGLAKSLAQDEKNKGE